MKITKAVLAFTTLLLLLYEAWTFLNDWLDARAGRAPRVEDTISEAIWSWINQSRFLLLAAAILCGHLFGQSDDFELERRFKAWLNTKPLLIWTIGFFLGRWLWQKVHKVKEAAA